MKSALYSFRQRIVDEYVHSSLSPISTSQVDDKVQEYAKEVMSLGMVYLNYKDAVKEGDGGRIFHILLFCLFPVSG